jgi:hypothetical protein
MILKTKSTKNNRWMLALMRTLLEVGAIFNLDNKKTSTTQNGLTIRSPSGIIPTMVSVREMSTFTLIRKAICPLIWTSLLTGVIIRGYGFTWDSLWHISPMIYTRMCT